MEPRYRGGVVIFARSFARIHEANLKKQGILPLTFSDRATYDEIGEDDRISVLGLAELAPDTASAVPYHQARRLDRRLRNRAHVQPRADRMVPSGQRAQHHPRQANGMTVEELLELLASCEDFYDSLGDDGDPLPILAHSLQCALRLSEVAPDDDELIVAGLVHDIGHRLAAAVARSSTAALRADAVRDLLGERVATLVELHVPAKRYLVTVDGTYRASLSTGSTASLVHQGGPLDEAERAALEQRPELADALTLRRADEAAKDPDAVVPGLDHWRPVLDRVASARSGVNQCAYPH